MSHKSHKQNKNQEQEGFKLDGRIIDVVNGTIFSGEIGVRYGKIASVQPSASTSPLTLFYQV